MGTNGYANPSALVETEWSQAHLDDPSVRVVEVDEDVTAYATGHIPGAVGWNWTADLRAWSGGTSSTRRRSAACSGRLA